MVPVDGNPNADMIARTRVNATTTKLVNKKDGNILSTATLVVSADGKTLTITTTGISTTLPALWARTFQRCPGLSRP
jgi:hypothetical protein